MMVIQNSRSRKAARKAQKMEMQEQVQGLNGVEKSVVETVTSPPIVQSVELSKLYARREEIIQRLNGAKAVRADLQAQQESISAQIEAQEESIGRQTGALIMLNTLIQEIDPNALRQLQGG